MKIMKNKFFKLAVLMVMLCLVTTCAIGTTFAKYVSGNSADDAARVAKWGVVVEMVSDDLFENEYTTDDNTYAGALSVKSQNGDSVVAPGTKGSTVFSISGAPEVAVRIDIVFNATSQVKLPGATAAEDYYPIVFTLKQTEDYQGNPATGVLAQGTLDDIAYFLNEVYSGAEYAPNTVLDSKYELSWEWAYESGNDAKDTLLGDVMAGTQTVAGAVTEVAYEISVTVTQID